MRSESMVASRVNERSGAKALWIVAVAALLAVQACTPSPSPPNTFGVNLTIVLDGIPRSDVKLVQLRVTGAEQFQKQLDIDVFAGNEARIHYAPGVQSGVLTFAADALNASGGVIASGMSVAITLVPGKAVTALVDIHGAPSDGPVDAPTDGGGDRQDASGPGKKGESCAGGRACDTGLTCADGFCCESACTGSCTACNLPGREGTCANVPTGTRPATGHAACTVDDPSTCKHDGTCDGSGACRNYPVGTTCRGSTCDTTTDAFTPEFKCDGTGVCQTNIAIACAPYRCKDTAVCWSSCTDASQCAATKSCVAGSCGLKANGASCTTGQECNSTFCTEGVCCDSACTAGCQSCNLGGTTRGTCTNVPAGQDPKGICPAGTAENAVCSPGGCAGTGGTACVKASTATTCRTGTCANGNAINPASCQATGVCPPLTQTACGVYTCGATACNTTCSHDTDCIGGHYCASNGTCQTQKAAGVACAATTECAAGLTCLDGVCCTSAACPTCRNCGATGMCTVVVASADDTSGSTCSGTRSCNSAGSCLSVNGQSCGSSGTSCVSGNCVDGVCCSVASCGTCRNCGSTGTCSVMVTNADDTSASACAADNTCDATATCKARWSLVGKVTVGEAPRYYFTAGVGNYIYFANASNEGSMAQYFKSFNVVSAVFADETLANNPLCDCGYEGSLVGQPLDGRVYYAANDDRSYTAGGSSWPVMGTGYVSRGEAATAVVGQRIYYMGGRGGLTNPQAYDTVNGKWVTSGIAASPVGFSDACAGAFAGSVYVFGGGTLAAGTMLQYTESTNTWTTLSVSSPTCSRWTNLPTWRSKLVMPGGSGVVAFNPSTQSWDAPIPFPATGGSWATVTAGAAPDLYVIGWTNGAAYIYKYVFN